MSSKQAMRLLALVVVLVLLVGAGVAGAQDGAGTEGVIPCGDTTTCTMAGTVLTLRNAGSGNAFYGRADGAGVGVFGRGFRGVYGKTLHSAGAGVRAEAVGAGYGVLATSSSGDAIYVPATGQHALNVQSSGGAAIYVHTAGGSGVYVNSAGGDGMDVYSATWDGIKVYSAGDDGVHVQPTIGGMCYRCGWKDDDGFVVLNTGEVRSNVGFNTPSNAFAQMMDVEGAKASYELGDVLAVGEAGNGITERSSTSYSRAVVGVYSTAAGFIAGQPMSGDRANTVPVAILGVVPCKASAENGGIHPGDLLVTSSTPGHAMRADDPPPGTILGKALEALDEGTGVILVLVTLQ